MASQNGPQHTPRNGGAPDETEPLLGRPGDALQKPDEPMLKNLFLGTGLVAQVGSILMLAIVWATTFTHPILPLFSTHPLLQSLGLFTLTQAILILQPTNTPETKKLGARVHASLNLLSFLLFVAGITLIEVNKKVNHVKHFKSLHGYLGIITGILMLLQYIFGFLMWGVPVVFGGIDNAKSLWKYHRYSGYVMLLMILVTVGTAVDTDYNRNVLGIKWWSFTIGIVLVVAGIFPRIQLTKLGIHRAH